MVEVLKELCDSDGCAGSKHILVAEAQFEYIGIQPVAEVIKWYLKKSLSNKDSLEFVFELWGTSFFYMVVLQHWSM